MSNASDAMRDERTVTVENASYRWAYLTLSFGLLVATGYRAFAKGESSWDLFGLLIVGGLVATTYQGAHRVLTRRWVIVSVGMMVIAAVVGALFVLLRRAAH